MLMELPPPSVSCCPSGIPQSYSWLRGTQITGCFNMGEEEKIGWTNPCMICFHSYFTLLLAYSCEELILKIGWGHDLGSMWGKMIQCRILAFVIISDLCKRRQITFGRYSSSKVFLFYFITFTSCICNSKVKYLWICEHRAVCFLLTSYKKQIHYLGTESNEYVNTKSMRSPNKCWPVMAIKKGKVAASVCEEVCMLLSKWSGSISCGGTVEIQAWVD